jgi:hypothetical protein
MSEEQKPKRKYTKRAKPAQPEVYSVLVRVTRGRKTETIHCESTRIENGCLVAVSLDGPPPLIEKTRYIPLGSAEIEVCARQQPVVRWVDVTPPGGVGMGSNARSTGSIMPMQSGPQLMPGPLELLRQREAGMPVAPPRQPSQVVERNSDGVPVVTAGFLDGSPS